MCFDENMEKFMKCQGKPEKRKCIFMLKALVHENDEFCGSKYIS